GLTERSANVSGYPVAVEQGHVDVYHDDVWFPGASLAHAIQPIVRLLDRVSLGLEEAAKTETDVVVVVNDEDSASHHGLPSRSGEGIFSYRPEDGTNLRQPAPHRDHPSGPFNYSSCGKPRSIKALLKQLLMVRRAAAKLSAVSFSRCRT